MDKSESVTPANNAVQPAAPKTVGGWFAANLLPLAFVVAIIALIIWRGLIFADVAVVVLGLGLVIFIHELGHFLAAKLCDVHVETFSIGFGKALPGCQFKYGETTYKIGWIPLGGYVKMVGEGENADTEEAEEDPRSFKNKSVGKRMLIISAGVIMNVILGCICFMVAYSHGVEETPAIVGTVSVGSPAWEQDLRAGDRIIQIGDIQRPTFDDIRPEVMSVERDKAIPFVIDPRNGDPRVVQLVPRRNPEDLYPMVGINPIDQLVLQKKRPGGLPPVRRDSPAAEAVGSDGSKFQGGDKIIASSYDPEKPGDIKEISKDSEAPSGTKLDTIEFMRNLQRMRGKPMGIRVDRDGKQIDFTVGPAWTRVLPGVRFQMGRIAAIRVNSPAAKATLVQPAGEPGLQTAVNDQPGSGDKIIAIEVEAVNKNGETVIRRYVDEFSKEKDAKVEEVLLDPLRLGYDMEVWAETAQNLNVRMTVLRAPTGGAKTGKRVTFDLVWDPTLVFTGEATLSASAPMSLSGLGLAYYVDIAIDSVANQGNGLAKGDIITDVRFREADEKNEDGLKPGDWIPLKPHQGAYLHAMIQRAATPEVDFKVTRAGQMGVEVTMNSAPAVNDWPAIERGFVFPYDTRIQKADNLWDALGMGMHRTWRTVKVIYQTLYATIFRQISAETMSGPLQIANVSYRIAGYDLWQFILFIGLININLAVVNFLPIPLLDGGHMVFLIYEKIRGKPAPEKVQEYALYAGLIFILLLMAFVIFLDVRKLFF